jgi:hypothetical protein
LRGRRRPPIRPPITHPPPPKDLGCVDPGLSDEDQVGSGEEIRTLVEEPSRLWRSSCDGGGARLLAAGTSGRASSILPMSGSGKELARRCLDGGGGDWL